MRAAALMLAALALAGCGHGSGTSLDVVFLVSSASGFKRIHQHVACDPPRGNVVSPVASCAAISRGERLLFARESRTTCIGGLFFIDANVNGRHEGKGVSRRFGHCGDGHAIDAWIKALDLTLLDVSVASGGRARFLEVSCDPPGGDVGEPLRVCRSLARAPELLAPPRAARCGERSPSVWVFGLYRGERIEARGRCAFARGWMEILLGFYTPPPERRR